MITRILVERMDERVARDRDDGDYAFFHALMLKLEYVTKVVVSAMVACIGDDSERHRYTLEHRLVRADSLGTWMEVLSAALSGPPAQVLLPDARNLSRELTQPAGPDDWRYACVNQLKEAAQELGMTATTGGKIAFRQFFDIAAQLRNRARGHGAPTASQCGNACAQLDSSLNMLVENLQLFGLPWAYLHRNLSGKYRVVPLLNDCSSFDKFKRAHDIRLPDGVYVDLSSGNHTDQFVKVPLVFTDPDVLDIFLPNGNFKNRQFETLSYTTNSVSRCDGSAWSISPARLPASETEGDIVLSLMGNAFANLPPEPTHYVARPDLEMKVEQELLTRERHPIIALTGPGGIGKTTIALKVAHRIATSSPSPYDVMLWISARDIDLLDSGPKQVSRRVFTQQDISRAAVDLLEPADRGDRGFSPDGFFEQCLAQGAAGPTLFVLDNFETLRDPVDTVEWLDAHIRPPNKVLITTRFRDFRGDYPIQINGMSDDEAASLVEQHAAWLGIAPLLSSNYKMNLVKESEGHPYVIKILLGQVAKEGKAVNPKRIVAASDNLLNALFRRTYNALSPAAQRVFLLLSSWKVVVPEIAVEAVSLRPGTERFDVAHALDELVRFSLVESISSGDDIDRFVGVPLAAAVYGQRELEVSPFKVAVEEDRKILMEFGAGKREDSIRGVYPRIEHLVRNVAKRASSDQRELETALPILEYLANRFPTTYLRLADLVLEAGDNSSDHDKAKEYIRNFLREADGASRHDAWIRLARLCEVTGDPRGEIHSICEAALLPTVSISELGELANHINNRIRDLKGKRIEEAWSSEVRELLARVAQVMERHLNELSATDCSRLAWLYLNIGRHDRAGEVARIGIGKDSDNFYCQRLVEQLDSI